MTVKEFLEFIELYDVPEDAEICNYCNGMYPIQEIDYEEKSNEVFLA